MFAVSLKKVAKLVFISFAAYIVVIVGLIIYYLDHNTRSIVSSERKWLTKYEKDLRYIYTEVFPLAEKCAEKESVPTSFATYKDNCGGKVRSLLDAKFDNILDYCSFTDWKDCGHGSRLPAYFIRLKDENHIEKLFQSGVYFVETVDTPGEKKAVQILQGNADPFPFPLYTCCGGDDVPRDFPLLPPRNYLKDFYAEIELILLVKNTQGKTMGAFVKLHGD